MHLGLPGDHTHISNGRAEASNWMDVEIEIPVVTVRAADARPLDRGVKAPCWRKGRDGQQLLELMFSLWN